MFKISRQKKAGWLTLLILSLATFPIRAAETPDTIVGAFIASMGKPGNSLEIQLVCQNETNCVYTTKSKLGEEPPHINKQVLNRVNLMSDISFAASALQYVIEHQDGPIYGQDNVDLMSRLRPVLSTKPFVKKCWDLNYTGEMYMLVCHLDRTPIGSSSMYLFTALIADCGGGFCGYVIEPLSREKVSDQ